MTITREQMIKRLCDKTGYFQKDIRVLLSAMDEEVREIFGKVTEDEDVSVQIVEGVKIGCKVVGTRYRVDPRTQEPIVCDPTVKMVTKYSDKFKKDAQDAYDEHGKKSE